MILLKVDIFTFLYDEKIMNMLFCRYYHAT